MNKAYLLTGANIGDKILNLTTAKQLIHEQCGNVVKSSSLYETAAWGNTDQPSFLNQALEINTTLKPKQLMKKILAIEKSMGRIREKKFGPRIIDIDILLFNDEQHNDPFLRIPHPELQNRLFALIPLHEIAADVVHPVFGKTISQLVEECRDTLEVKKAY